MDFKQIQELIKAVDESNLTTVEIENDTFRILLKKEEKPVLAGVPAPAAPATSAAPAASAAMTAAEQPPANTIKSPIVGTFYASSAPGAPPFVQPGSKVAKGDILCIIEAMKLMNEIEAEEDCQILEVLVQDGEMIEYGQALFAVSK